MSERVGFKAGFRNKKWHILTGSSGAKCSDGDSLRLYAAQTISRDFLRVSSILQAVNKAAAAASLKGSDWPPKRENEQ